eukprot:COSAG01_NODE_21792_length_884_cov_12.180892_1_plen_75_part_00
MNGWRPFVGLDGSGRPFSKVLGELARNREATYEITALWRCPRALLLENLILYAVVADIAVAMIVSWRAMWKDNE